MPSEPPQPSSPQTPGKGTHWQAKLALQAVLGWVGLSQVPQDPPQPSLPQVLPVQLRTQVHKPLRQLS